jgi:hypothetical protein
MDGLVKNHPDSALVIGLNTVDSLEAINSGALDKEIEQLLDHLGALKRPVYVRFGDEFDRMWNHYDPAQFKQAWIKFHQRMKEKGVDNVALVWQSAAYCQGTYNAKPIEAWYPGNEVVNFARQHHKAVMMAESTPQGYDIGQLTYSTDGAKLTHKTSGTIWKEWFAPYFEYIRNHADVIKAVTYINTFWDSQKRWRPPYSYSYWGDARVQANPGILEKWKAEILDVRYLQAAPDLFEKLGYAP